MRQLLLLLALVVAAAHVKALPHTLEDIDSINFAMGVESFDVSRHQPHPPGYPVYIALAKVSTTVIGAVVPSWDRDHRAAAGLAIWSAIAGTLAVFVIADFWLALGLTPALAGLASLVAVMSPLFWFTAGRPMSDVPGLVAALLVQTWLFRGLRAVRSGGLGLPRDWIWAALGLGFIIGLRAQTLLLTGPLFLWAIGELIIRRQKSDVAKLLGAVVLGVLVWAIPLVWDSGGVGGYLSALGSQGSQDFSGVEMLATRPSWRLFQVAVRRTFIEQPWQVVALANVVLVLAVVGAFRLAKRGRPTLAAAFLAFWPYLVFHLTFQETVTVRYALPLIIPVAGLAVIGLSALGVRVATAGAVAIAVASLIVVQPRLEAFASTGSAVFRAFRDMQRALPRQTVAPADRPRGASDGQRSPGVDQPLVRTHHQVWHGVRRIMDWYRPYWDVGPQPFPYDREWQAIVRHWISGETRPVWLLADVSRNDVKLFDWRTTHLRGTYEPPTGMRELIGGVHLDALSWWTIERPRWMLGTGWSLTPEVAGMTSKDANGPHQRPADAFLLRDKIPTRVMIGARYLAPAGSPPGTVATELDGRPIGEWPISSGGPWFVQWVDFPAGMPDGQTPYAWLTVRVRSAEPDRPAPAVGLEQFDAAPSGDLIYAFLDDWNELEGNPRTGKLWRWTTARSSILVNGAGEDLRLRLEGESPLRYFERAPTVVVKAGERELVRFNPSADFTQDVTLPAAALAAAGGRVTIETDMTWVPGEREASPDRRRLGLRLFKVEIRRP